jgi:ectoine hydroxylase-related dioxygenase (phytanoyl-CoA dioxygenase family)
MMTPEQALQKRQQLQQDGYCVIDDILSAEFLDELRVETERLMENHVPPEEFKYQGQHVTQTGAENTIIQRLLDWAPAHEALEQMQYGEFASAGSIILLTKDPGEPALYWHQDWMQWNDPISVAPWPQIIFLSYYLQDTTVENGCLKVLPGTHLKRIPLHDQLVAAHEQGARVIAEDHPTMFCDHPDQVDVQVNAGSLVLADARVLHSAHRNQTDRRRTLVLAWHRRPFGVPANWEGEVPEVIANRAADAEYEGSRIPGVYLT